MSKEKPPTTALALYLSQLVKRCFGQGESGGAASGKSAWHQEICFLLYDGHLEPPSGKGLNLSTVTHWCSGKTNFLNAQEPHKSMAIQALLVQLPESERDLTRQRLEGRAPLPEETTAQVAAVVAEAKGATYLHSGTLVSSAVRAAEEFSEAPAGSAAAKRAEEELSSFKLLFRDTLSLQEFSQAAGQAFLRYDEPEFRWRLFCYAVDRIRERTDFDLAERIPGRDLSRSDTAAMIRLAAWLEKAIVSGNDEQFEAALAFRAPLLAKMFKGERHGPAAALTLNILASACFNAQIPQSISKAEIDQLLSYLHSPSHDLLKLRTSILLLGYNLSAEEIWHPRESMRRLIASADAAAARQFNPAIHGTPLFRLPTDHKLAGLFAQLASRYDSWLVRYSLLYHACLRGMTAPGFTLIARDILANPKTGRDTQAAALCYLWQENAPKSRQLIANVALDPDHRSQARALATFLHNAPINEIGQITGSGKSLGDHDRKAVLSFFAARLIGSNSISRWFHLRRLKRSDQKAVREILEGQPGTAPVVKGAKDKSFLGREIQTQGHFIHKLKAKDSGKKWAYYFVLVYPDKERAFMMAISGAGMIDLDDYGEVVASCYGEEPDSQTKDFLKTAYGFDI